MSFKPTDEQQAIYDEFRSGKDNVVVIARAGVGKTTTAVSGVSFAPERNVLFTCFNKRIAVEGNNKLTALGVTNAQFATLHSIGARTVQRYWPGVRVGQNFERQNNLTDRVCNGRAPDAIRKLVSKLHTLGREIIPHATKAEELYELAEQFECIPSPEWEEDGFDLHYVCGKVVQAMEHAAVRKPADGFIDFSDMIFLPVRNGWLSKRYDMVIVDEAQDLTVAKLELAQGVCKGRMMVIGDDKQAIYGFCGADSKSLFRLRDELDAKVLHLTKTFRCGKAIVEQAQKFVPDFEAAETNSDGAIEFIGLENLVEAAGPGNFVLSRVNAPLVSIAMRLLKAGKRTKIAGRDIGKGLVALVRKLRARTVPDFLARVDKWNEREQRRLRSRYASKLDSPTYKMRAEALEDQAEMLTSLSEGAKGVQDIVNRIESLFTDNGLGDAGVVTCSSVHKSKGLEADKVFILSDTLRDFNEEELNIQYVAVTRAINTLVYVHGLAT